MRNRTTSPPKAQIFSVCLLVVASVSLGGYAEGNAADTNGRTTASTRPDRMTPFQRSLAEYNALVAELDADLAAYRASTPLLAKFSDVYTNTIFPLTRQGYRAELWLADAKKRGVQDLSDYNKRKANANKVCMRILAVVYKDIYPEFHKAVKAGRFTLDNEQDKNYFTKFHAFLQASDNSLSQPFEQHYPYTDKNTFEYWYFVRNLSNTALMVTSPLQKLVKQVPPELKEKERKVKQLHAKVFLSPGAPDSDAERPADATAQPDRMTPLQRSLRRYNALVAELNADFAAYRASIPLFAKFSDVYIKEIIPLNVKGIEAGKWLGDARKRGTPKWDPTKYDKQKAGKAYLGILATIYKEIYPEFRKAMEAGWFTLSSAQGKNYFQTWEIYLQFCDNSLSRPFEQHYPYKDKNTYEYWYFAKDLMMAALFATAPVRKTVEQIPFQLKQRQDKLKQLHAELVRQAKQSGGKVALPDPYTEPYLKKLEDEEARFNLFGRSRR